MNKHLCLCAITGAAILIVNLARAAPPPPKEENAIDYIQIWGEDAPGFPWKVWFAKNTHQTRAIRFTVRFQLDYTHDAEPGRRVSLGNSSPQYPPKLVGARFISR
jgi:hypothetical protein